MRPGARQVKLKNNECQLRKYVGEISLHHYCVSLWCSCPALAAGGDGLFVRKFIEASEYDTYEREVNVSLAIPPDKKHLFCAVVAHGRSIKYVFTCRLRTGLIWSRTFPSLNTIRTSPPAIDDPYCPPVRRLLWAAWSGTAIPSIWSLRIARTETSTRCSASPNHSSQHGSRITGTLHGNNRLINNSITSVYICFIRTVWEDLDTTSLVAFALKCFFIWPCVYAAVQLLW